MSETHNIQIGNRIFQLEAVCRAEYGQGDEARALMKSKSWLRVYMIDGKDFTLFNESADILWDVLKSTAMVLQN